MHPIIAYDLAMQKIAESHRQAERERRFRIVDEDVPSARLRRTPATNGLRARLAAVPMLAGLLR
jgi:hypothetical protein